MHLLWITRKLIYFSRFVIKVARLTRTKCHGQLRTYGFLVTVNHRNYLLSRPLFFGSKDTGEVSISIAKKTKGPTIRSCQLFSSSLCDGLKKLLKTGKRSCLDRWQEILENWYRTLSFFPLDVICNVLYFWRAKIQDTGTIIISLWFKKRIRLRSNVRGLSTASLILW